MADKLWWAKAASKDFTAKLHRKTQAAIEEYGWTCIGVMSDGPIPSFSYSVGFRELDHPELIVVGLSPTDAHSVLWTLYERVKAGETFAPGDSISEVITNFDVRVRALPPDGRPLNLARTYYGVDELPALQVLWPDPAGIYPDEEGCAEPYLSMQDLNLIREDDDPV